MESTNDLIVVCPFCGADGKSTEHLIHVEYDGKVRYINCVSCGATGPRVKTWEESWVKWNKRA